MNSLSNEELVKHRTFFNHFYKGLVGKIENYKHMFEQIVKFNRFSKIIFLSLTGHTFRRCSPGRNQRPLACRVLSRIDLPYHTEPHGFSQTD